MPTTSRSWASSRECSASYERRLDGAHQRADAPARPAPGADTLSVAPLHRTLEQELLALLRGASLECPVCGEFVLHEGAKIRCPECDLVIHARHDSTVVPVAFDVQAG